MNLTPNHVRQALWLHVELDWEAYWQRFKEAHGDPVPFRGRLLFADGWMYSATDPAGPEWMPPEDGTPELKELQRAYWLIRRKAVHDEARHLRNLVGNLRALQGAKSVPLQHVRVTGTDEHGRQVVMRGDVDVSAIEQGRLAALEQDVARCDDKLKELGHANTPV